MHDLAEEVALIKEHTPRGSFLGAKHTRRTFREHWRPGILSRDSYETWQAKGESIEGICRLRKEREIGLVLHTTVCALNLDALPEIVELMTRVEPDHYDLNCLIGRASALESWEDLAVPYTKVVEKLREPFGRRRDLHVSMSDVPVCQLVGKLPPTIMSLREDFRFADLAEDGELCVALRCALLRGDLARLYAGCGIVADSVPSAELAETEVKLQALLPLLA